MKIYYTLFVLLFPYFSAVAQDYGEAGHPMNKDTDNRAIIDYWETQYEDGKSVYDAAYKVLSGDRHATYHDVSRDDAFRKLSNNHGVEKLGGPMLGNVQPDAISVWLRTLKPSKVEVEVFREGYKEIFGPVYSTPETDLACIVDISGLRPSSEYSYRVLIDGVPIQSPSVSRFQTAPDNLSSPARIAFGTCPHRWGLGNKKLLRQIQNRRPLAALLYGDIAVQDRNNHLGMHRADYLLRDFLPAWSDFVRSVPVYASWDDHDYFDNDKAGIPEGYTDADRQNVWRVFRNSWNNPSYGLGENGKGIFTRMRVGPFDIIMTDNRYFRDREKGYFLGKEQMEWLKRELLACEAPFIILSSGTMWSDYVSDGKDSWGDWDPAGREEIFRLIEENNIGGVLLISGDRHGARGFRIPRASGFDFYEFEPASMGARVGPPATRPSWDTQLFGIDAEFAFGEFTYVPSEDDPAVVFRLIKEDGNIIYELELKRSQMTPSNF